MSNASETLVYPYRLNARTTLMGLFFGLVLLIGGIALAVSGQVTLFAEAEETDRWSQAILGLVAVVGLVLLVRIAVGISKRRVAELTPTAIVFGRASAPASERLHLPFTGITDMAVTAGGGSQIMKVVSGATTTIFEQVYFSSEDAFDEFLFEVHGRVAAVIDAQD